jgi:hypothetical protein
MSIANFSGGAICLLFAWILLRFKAVGLIAGYNTASLEEQEKYDKNKLAKYTGLMLLYMGIDLVLFGLLYLIVPSMLLFWVSWGIFLAICLGGLVYMNTGKRCYKDEYK